MADAETAAVLRTVAEGPPERVQFLAHHLPEIIQDKAECRAKLLAIARLPTVGRLDFLLAGFRRLGTSHNDTEVMQAVLSHDFSLRDAYAPTGNLFAAFGGHPAVRAIALASLTEMDAPWETLIESYAGDVEIRALIGRFLSSLPAMLRGVLVSSLGRRAVESSTLKDHLRQYRLESNTVVRTASAIAYYEAIGNDTESRAAAVVSLRQDAKAGGPWHEMIGQAALAGFIALDEVEAFHEAPGWKADEVASLNIFSFDNNSQLFTYVAKHWDRLTAALGTSLWLRLSERTSSDLWCWDHLAPYIGESSAIRADFLAYAGQETKGLSSRAIEALAREVPRSRLLREHCLRCFTDGPQDINTSPHDQRRRELVSGRVLGRQFADDLTIREQLEKHVASHPSAAIAGLSLAWRDSPTLVAEFHDLRAQRGRTRRYTWPDAAYLLSAFGSREDFCSFVSRLLENCTGNIWDFLPFCIDPLVERIKSEEGLGAHIIDKVKTTGSASEKASLPKLLALANHMDDDLRKWCEVEFTRQSNRTILPEFGLDAVSGEIRPVAHAILDALSPR